MDGDQILSRLETKMTWLNSQKNLPFETPMEGAAYIALHVRDTICALEQAEEKEAEEDARREAVEALHNDFD